MRAYAGGGAAAPQRGSHGCERGSGGAGTQAHAYGGCERMRAEVQRRHTEALLMLAYAGAGTQRRHSTQRLHSGAPLIESAL
jgi:hypothetical protein